MILVTNEDITRIRFLSQERGLFDNEIASVMDVHRVTVNRIRKQHNIPSPNLDNRRDKEQVCKRCGEVEYIPRRVRIKQYCGTCKKESLSYQRQKKREYMREYDKNKKHSAGMLQNGT